MKNLLLPALVSTAFVVGITITLCSLFASSPPDPVAATTTRDVHELKERLEALGESQEAIRRELTEMEKRLLSLLVGHAPAARAEKPIAAANDVEEEPPPLSPDQKAAEEKEEKEEKLDEALALLFDPEVKDSRKERVFKELAKLGLLDDVLLVYEERARENPSDPDVQSELGVAYIQKLLSVNVAEQGTWFKKADAAFDRALALDERHWPARFVKAVSYAFSPPLLGYHTKAIEHFEILREQQESGPPQKHFAQTYLYLGNLYSNQGKAEKAQEVWEKGLSLYPDFEELRNRLPKEPSGSTDP